MIVFVLSVLILASTRLAPAQPSKKVHRIGFLVALSSSSTATRVEAFKQGLHDLGYVEGENIVIEYRYAEGKLGRLPDLAAELVRLNVDVIVAGGEASIRAAKTASGTIPIVMAYVADPVVFGLVASLARPGGNITGLTTLSPELGGKRLELLKEIIPKLSRVAVLGDRDNQNYGPQLKEIEVAAQAMGLQLQPVQLRGPDDLETAFSVMTRERAGALIGLTDTGASNLRGQIAELAAKNRLPAIYPLTEFVDAGGLMSYGPNYTDLLRRAAAYVDKILKGTKPADLPVEQPMKFELIINLKAAKQIGLTIPPNVLARADRVIK
jgi:putative ABC transport system substrate-binding protein